MGAGGLRTDTVKPSRRTTGQENCTERLLGLWCVATAAERPTVTLTGRQSAVIGNDYALRCGGPDRVDMRVRRESSTEGGRQEVLDDVGVPPARELPGWLHLRLRRSRIRTRAPVAITTVRSNPFDALDKSKMISSVSAALGRAPGRAALARRPVAYAPRAHTPGHR
jgi:hypothetical protein